MNCCMPYPNCGHLFPVGTKVIILTEEDFKFTGTIQAVVCFGCKDQDPCQTQGVAESETLIKLALHEIQHPIGTPIQPNPFPTELYINLDQIIGIGSITTF